MSFFNFAFSTRSFAAVTTAAACVLAAAPQASAAASTGQVMFSYQGRVKVGGQAFEGTGQFKFSIVNTSGTVTLWSNDGTGELGEQPNGSINLPVEDGVFNVMMGDPAASMQPINPTVFQSQTPIRLRVWFNDGVNGFQQLNPDHKLTNLTLTTIETGDEDFTIYVNGTTGNDADNGLTPETAKKTIQAAVDTLPDRIKCNVTIDIADGIYPESVRVFGMAVEPGKNLTFIGDETWTAASAGNPTVQVTGQDSSAANAPKVRQSGFHIVQSSGIELKGLELEGYLDPALYLEGALVDTIGCRLANSLDGVFAVGGSTADFTSTKADTNVNNGFYIGRQTSAHIRDCKALNNGIAGFRANAYTAIQYLGASQTSGNAIGALAQHNSSFVFTGTMAITQNYQYGLFLNMDSYSENDFGNTTVSGNGNSNQPFIDTGGHRYNY